MNESKDIFPNLDVPLLTLRAVFLASAVGLGLYLAQQNQQDSIIQYAAMIVAGFLALVVIFADAMAVARSSIATVSAIVFGLLIGFLTAQLFIGIVSLMGDFESPAAKPQLEGIRLAVTLIFSYLGPAYLLRTKDDFRFIVPYVEFRRQGGGPRPLVLDTSAIIDGRIVDLAKVGVFSSPFVVGRFVVEEIQRIADSNDKNRRTRGRRGLDRLNTLSELPGIEVEFPQSAFTDAGDEVDRRLIELSKARGGKLVTVDFNLQKVCELEGVPVLNLNQVALAARTPFIPGDTLQVEIVKAGQSPGQGVGYLDDGTMVVVEGARQLKGSRVTTVVTSCIQSSAGVMLFARITDSPAPGEDDPPQTTEAQAGEEQSGPEAEE